MPASVLLAFGGVVFLAVLGAAFVLIARPSSEEVDRQRALAHRSEDTLERTLERIEQDVKHVRELLDAKR